MRQAVPVATTRHYALPPLVAAAWGVLTAAVGLGVTWLVVRGMEPGPGMADVAVAVLGLLASTGLGVAVWLALLVRAAVRLFPRGSRLAPVIVSAAVVLALVVTWSTLASRLEDGGGLPSSPAEALVALPLLLALPAPSVVYALWARRRPPG